jgi:hypothetical protein
MYFEVTSRSARDFHLAFINSYVCHCGNCTDLHIVANVMFSGILRAGNSPELCCVTD